MGHIEQEIDGATRQEMRDCIDRKFPQRWKPAAIGAHFNTCTVNNPKVHIHHKSVDRFFYRSEDGRFHRYNAEIHGVNTSAPSLDTDTEDFAGAEEANI